MTKRRAAALCAAIAGAFILAGCIPAKFSGYEASGPGKRERDYCVAGLNELRLVESRDGVGIHWRAGRDEDTDTITMHVYMTIPAGVTVQLTSPALVLDSEHWAQPRLLSVQVISAPGPRQFTADAELAGSDEDSMGMYSFWFSLAEDRPAAETGIPAVEHFTARMPALLVNGVAWDSEAVTFRKYSRWGVYTCIQ